MLVNFDEKSKRATLDVEHDNILADFEEGSEKHALVCVPNDILFHPEYGRFMIEATPLKPYTDSLQDLVYVEKNMAARRQAMVAETKGSGVKPLSITSFPLMGVGRFTTKQYEPSDPASHSLFLPAEIINRHVRFPTLTKNIRTRRGQKVAINVPIYKDLRTQSLEELDQNIPKRDLFPEDSEPFLGAALPGHIYMDAMGFGMGCSCLQVTMQAPDLAALRRLYDTLLPLTPVFLALTAATLVFKGTLADQDVRWNVIARAVDDRTPIERDVPPLEGHKAYGGVALSRAASLGRITKSRYESVSSYLGDLKDGLFTHFKEQYNDITLEMNESVRKSLLESPDFDDQLANHFAHLFIRDPLVLFSEKVRTLDDDFDDDHFQNIQSTNWQTLRFKPPAAHPHGCLSGTPGWRVEFRPMEIQVTDFENAAFSVFLVLVAKAILKFAPDWYIPISQIDENMETAHKRDSVLNDGFWFKGSEGLVKMSIDEIVNGSVRFEGLVSMVERYLEGEDVPEEIKYYIKLISGRAAGKIPTFSHYSRDFIRGHPQYNHDSLVGDAVNYDFLKRVQEISEYKGEGVSELFGDEIGSYLSRHAVLSVTCQSNGFVSKGH